MLHTIGIVSCFQVTNKTLKKILFIFWSTFPLAFSHIAQLTSYVAILDLSLEKFFNDTSNHLILSNIEILREVRCEQNVSHSLCCFALYCIFYSYYFRSVLLCILLSFLAKLMGSMKICTSVSNCFSKIIICKYSSHLEVSTIPILISTNLT